MKIDNQKLIELIADKTELDAETAEKQLAELVSRVKETADKGKALEIKGFGLFFRSRSGELEFKPSKELETEVNYKYAGMEPVEVKKPRDIADEFTGEAEESKPEDEPEPQGQKKGSDEEGTDWLDDIWKGEEEKSRETETGETEEDLSEEDPFAGLMLDDPGEPPKSESDHSQLKQEKSDDGKKKSKNPINTLVTALVTGLVIVVGILVVIEFGFLNILTGTDEAGPAEVTQIEPQPQAPVEMEPEEAEPPVAEEEEQEALPETEEVPVEQEEISEIQADEPSQTFGLHGQLMEFEERFFTIVLHSMRNEEAARSIRENLDNEGYRAMITTHEHAEMGTMWRVGIGQFETLQSAQQAVQELPQNYRDNHFIGIIQ